MQSLHEDDYGWPLVTTEKSDHPDGHLATDLTGKSFSANDSRKSLPSDLVDMFNCRRLIASRKAGTISNQKSSAATSWAVLHSDSNFETASTAWTGGRQVSIQWVIVWTRKNTAFFQFSFQWILKTYSWNRFTRQCILNNGFFDGCCRMLVHEGDVLHQRQKRECLHESWLPFMRCSGLAAWEDRAGRWGANDNGRCFKTRGVECYYTSRNNKIFWRIQFTTNDKLTD